MKPLKNRFLAGALVTVLMMTVAVSSVLAWSSGPPDGRTGAPGESTCVACHDDFALNSGTGTLTVSGIGATYEPGQVYDLAVSLADPDASRWGFEFTMLNGAGVSVGALESIDANTQTSTAGDRVYGKQTSTGTQLGTTEQAGWTMRWTAPGAGTGDVSIYLAGNAANGDFTNDDDRIYAISQAFAENDISAAPLPAVAAARLLPNYPNPFNPRTTISYELSSEQPVRLVVYAIDGKQVRTLEQGVRSEGTHEVVWDGMDDQGRGVPSGTYVTRLETGRTALSRTMVLVR